MPGRNASCRSTRTAGLTLIELMISLALMVALLVSVGAAISAALRSSTENAKIAAVTQTGRWIVNRITDDVRTASAIDTTATTITIIPPDDGSGTEEIQYDYTGNTLYLRRTVSGTQTDHVLLGASDDVSVTGFAVLAVIGQDWQGVDCVKTVTVQLSLDCDGNALTLTASSSPRRNQLY